MELTAVAHIESSFPEKFGIPRQSGLVPGLTARVVFEPEYAHPDAVRGLEGYSHIWLLWVFSANRDVKPRLTVRPPRLGGNTRMGVFATRSPYRPNPIGLSSVRLLAIENVPGKGPTLLVEGADLLDGTPIVDIKPYLPHTDVHPEATGGFSADVLGERLEVELPSELEAKLDETERGALRELLAQDPRPGYQDDAGRVYKLCFGKYDIAFTVEGEKLTVRDISERAKGDMDDDKRIG